MGHRFEAIEYLGRMNGKIARIVKAKWKGLELDVFYEDFETKDKFYRNLTMNYLAGYLVNFPGEKVKGMYGYPSYIQELEDWAPAPFDVALYAHYDRKEQDYLTLMEEYPEYKYMLKKLMKLTETYYVRLDNVFGCMRLYKDYPEMEYLICHEFFYLIGNVSIYKYKPENKKLFMNYLIKYKSWFRSNNNMGSREIMACAKAGISPTYHQLVKAYPADVTKYLIDKGFYKLGERYYGDYQRMATEMGHDIKDPYWRYPSDLVKAHNKVMEEKAQFELNKNKEKDKVLKQVVKPLQKNNKLVDGYNIFVANGTDQLIKASEELHQCLMTANYIDKVIEQESIIVMIWEKDTPIATAEIDYNKKVNQFYANELNHNNCKPTEAVKNAFYSWLESCKLRKVKLAN